MRLTLAWPCRAWTRAASAGAALVSRDSLGVSRAGRRWLAATGGSATGVSLQHSRSFRAGLATPGRPCHQLGQARRLLGHNRAGGLERLGSQLALSRRRPARPAGRRLERPWPARLRWVAMTWSASSWALARSLAGSARALSDGTAHSGQRRECSAGRPWPAGCPSDASATASRLLRICSWLLRIWSWLQRTAPVRGAWQRATGPGPPARGRGCRSSESLLLSVYMQTIPSTPRNMSSAARRDAVTTCSRSGSAPNCHVPHTGGLDRAAHWASGWIGCPTNGQHCRICCPMALRCAAADGRTEPCQPRRAEHTRAQPDTRPGAACTASPDRLGVLDDLQAVAVRVTEREHRRHAWPAQDLVQRQPRAPSRQA